MDTSSIFLLSEAYKAFKSKRYSESAVLIEKINLSSSYMRDPYPHFLLALSYLFTNRFDLSEKEISRMKSIDAHYAPLLQLQAFLTMKSAKDLNNAISAYIDLSSKNIGDKYAKRALKSLRSAESFNAFQQKAKLVDFVDIPKPGKNAHRSNDKKVRNKYISGSSSGYIKKAVIIFGAATAAGLIISAVFIFADINIYDRLKSGITSIISLAENIPSNETVDMMNISGPEYELIRKINERAVPEFYYSSSEMLSDFNNARFLIKKGEHNKAVLLLNKIMNSNAGMNVKEKTDFLIKYITESDDRKFENIQYSSVLEKPHLYRGFALAWSGKAANVKNKNGKVIFNLMIDYREKDRFSGMADIFCDERSEIKNGDSVAVSGIFINAMTESKRPYIQAKEIKKL